MEGENPQMIYQKEPGGLKALLAVVTVVMILTLALVGWLLYRDFTRGDEDISSKLQQIKNELLQDVDTKIEEHEQNIEDLLEEEEDGKGDSAELSVSDQMSGADSFVFLKATTENRPADYYIDVYSDESTSSRLGTVKSQAWKGSTSLISSDRLYFVNDQGGISYFDLLDKSFHLIDLPNIDSSDYNKVVGDFEIVENTIYYMYGECAEISECSIYSFNLNTSTNTLILSNIEFPKIGGIHIDYYDATSNSLILNSGSGDAGHAGLEIKSLDLSTKQITTLETYSYSYCGEEGEYCDETDVKNNQEYEDQTASTDSVMCGGVSIKKADKGIFIGCY